MLFQKIELKGTTIGIITVMLAIGLYLIETLVTGIRCNAGPKPASIKET